MGKTTVKDPASPNGLRTAETEIDILAVSREKDKYLVGECKFKNSPFTYSEYLETAAKLSAYKENANFFYMLFSENGFDEALINEAYNNDCVRLCPLKSIICKEES